MPKLLVSVAILGALGLAGLGGYSLSNVLSESKPAPRVSAAPAEVAWVAAAPGRVESKSGDIRVGAAVLGRVSQVPVAMNGKVEADR